MMIDTISKTLRRQRVNTLRRNLILISLIVAVLAAVSFSVPSAYSVTNPAPVGSMTIEKKHIFASRLILDYMKRRHYVKVPLNDELSTRIFDRYLKVLDPNRLYFLQQDISKFEDIQRGFDEFIEKSRLEPAFAIFLVYRTRVRKQVDVALSHLQGDFDFDKDESYQVDRSDATWAADQTALDELWRKRVKNDLLALIISGKEEKDARETLKNRYSQLLNRTDQLNANDVFQYYMNSYLVSVEPHTSYLSPRASENFKIRMSLSLEGIGAVLQSENEFTKITRVVTGGPADLSKQLRAGDRIVGVGQGDEGEVVDVIGWRLDDVVERIRGPKGSTVQLRILPEKAGNSGETRDISIIRDKIKLEEQAAKKSTHEFEFGSHKFKLGVIDIPTFYADFDGRSQGDPQYRSTTKDVRKLISELNQDNIDALVIDLRGNGGGALSEAISLTGLFIESGPIVQVRDTSGRIRVNLDPDPSVSYTGPLAVMVDRNSASASEIFAGAIQDYKRGLIVGEPTFGKGTVQNLVNLSRHSRSGIKLGQLKLTVAQFFRINGDSTQHRGVVPDVLFPTAANSEDEGERSYDNALPWSRITSAEYNTDYTYGDNGVLGQLIRHFDERKEHSAEIHYIREAEIFSAHTRNIKSISLDENRRRADRTKRREETIMIENRLRLARGLPPRELEPPGEEDVADSEEIETFPPDILLEETGYILADLIAIRGGETQLAHTGTGTESEKGTEN